MYPYNRGMTQTTSSLITPPRLSHLPPSLTERASMLPDTTYSTAAMSYTAPRQQFHSSDGYYDQRVSQDYYQAQNIYSSNFNRQVNTSTGIYPPPNPQINLHTQIYSPQDQMMSHTAYQQEIGDGSYRANNYFNNSSTPPIPSSYFPSMGFTDRQEICALSNGSNRSSQISKGKASGKISFHLFIKPVLLIIVQKVMFWGSPITSNCSERAFGSF